MDTRPVRDYFTALQARIVSALESLDGDRFNADTWQRSEGGGGTSCILEEGKLVERAASPFRMSRAWNCAQRLGAHTGIAGKPYEAMGVSLVCIRATVLPHGALKVRFFAAARPGGSAGHGPHALLRLRGRAKTSTSLQARARSILPTPPATRMVRRVLLPQEPQRAARLGGISSTISRRPIAGAFALVRSVGDHFITAYAPILERRRALPGARPSARSSATARALWDSTWCRPGGRCLACNRAAAPNPSSCPCRPPPLALRLAPAPGSAEAKLYSVSSSEGLGLAGSAQVAGAKWPGRFRAVPGLGLAARLGIRAAGMEMASGRRLLRARHIALHHALVALDAGSGTGTAFSRLRCTDAAGA